MPNLTPEIIAAAQAAQKKYGVFSSVSLAQFGLESAWGTKVTGKNNFFGMKARPGDPFTACTTHEVIKGHRTEIVANFRDFDSPEEAFDAHASLLCTAHVYHEAMSCDNPYDFADALTGVYATDPNYGKTLGTIIRQSHLEQYDV